MPPPRKVDLLPPDVRAELDRRIQARAFSGYAGLSAWLAELGYEISISRLAEHGQDLKATLKAVAISTKAAQLVVEANPDDEDNRSAAVISMLQTNFFDLMVGLNAAQAEDDPNNRAKLLANISKSFAHLTHASITQKKHGLRVRQEVESKLAQLDRETTGPTPTLDAATLRRVREEIYGVL